MIGSVAFLAPWLLVGLATLPILWWLLRAVPPAPGRRAFPGVRLLLGLTDPEKMPERTPWWLLLLRMLALAAAILAFAGPVLNPRPEGSSAPLLVLLDGGWGDAPDWARRVDRAAAALDGAARDGRPAAVLAMTDAPLPGEDLPWRAASDWTERLAGLAPHAWAPDRAAWAGWFAARSGTFETLWLSDGIGHGGEADLARALLARGPVTLVAPPETALALTPPRLEDGDFKVSVLRAGSAAARPVGVIALGPDPNGIERVLGSATAEFAAGEDKLDLAIDMPVELRNRVGRVQLAEARSAAGVVLADDSVRRRKVGLMSARPEGEAQDLIDPLHYLRKALEPFAEVIEAPLAEMLNAAPDVLILADVGTLSDAERAELQPWVEKGGLLIRFAGPRLAQSGAGQLEEDPLLPVRLRAGGRSIGGAMSWGAPRRLQPFPESSPFAGLPVPQDVDISSQVMAQPDPDLPGRVLASLEDGTPLVTGRSLGDGRVVLFHVTASADWSSLPLSGLFVQMLERLTQSAGGLASAPETLAGTVWTPLQVLDGFGVLAPPSLVAGVPGERLAEARPSPETPPGIYAGGERRVALNVMRTGDRLAPLGALPSGVTVETLDRPEEIRLGPWLIGLALLLLAIDVLATLAVSGRLRRGLRGAARAAGAVLLLAGLAFGAGRAQAQTGPDAEALERGEPDRARLCADRQFPGRRGQRGRAEGAEPGPLRSHRDRAGRSGGGGHRDPRHLALSVPLLAGHRQPGPAVRRRRGQDQRLPALRRHDPVRHPGRRSRRQRGRRHHAERPGAAAHRHEARHPAAGAGAARPRADPDLLPAAGLPRPLGRLDGLGRGLAGRRAGRGHAVPQPQRRGDAGGDRRQRLGLGLGGAGQRPADVPGRPRHQPASASASWR